MDTYTPLASFTIDDDSSSYKLEMSDVPIRAAPAVWFTRCCSLTTKEEFRK